jgi:putative restriction endonuclease
VPFDFRVRYGEIGKDFIECHHTIPASQLPANAKTRIEDVVLICSNCHSMIHRRRPWLNISRIRELILQE